MIKRFRQSFMLGVQYGLEGVHVSLTSLTTSPGNILWMLTTQCWKLIDFGVASRAGALLMCNARACRCCSVCARARFHRCTCEQLSSDDDRLTC